MWAYVQEAQQFDLLAANLSTGNVAIAVIYFNRFKLSLHKWTTTREHQTYGSTANSQMVALLSVWVLFIELFNECLMISKGTTYSAWMNRRSLHLCLMLALRLRSLFERSRKVMLNTVGSSSYRYYFHSKFLKWCLQVTFFGPIRNQIWKRKYAFLKVL